MDLQNWENLNKALRSPSQIRDIMQRKTAKATRLWWNKMFKGQDTRWPIYAINSVDNTKLPWIHNRSVKSCKTVLNGGWIQRLITIHTGPTTSPTIKSATDNEDKKRLEVVRKDSFLKDNHNTSSFLVTAAKLDKESHSDRTMDTALLSNSDTGREWSRTHKIICNCNLQ